MGAVLVTNVHTGQQLTVLQYRLKLLWKWDSRRKHVRFSSNFIICRLGHDTTLQSMHTDMVVRSKFPTTMADSLICDPLICPSTQIQHHPPPSPHMTTLLDELVFMYRHSNTADGKWDDSRHGYIHSSLCIRGFRSGTPTVHVRYRVAH